VTVPPRKPSTKSITKDTPQKPFEQTSLFGTNKPNPVKPIEAPASQKKPFVLPLYQALDSGDLRNNFMYLLRILMNGANRQPNTPASQRNFSRALLAELRIKKGIRSLELETRSAILEATIKKN
jgi:hypothetical protein